MTSDDSIFSLNETLGVIKERRSIRSFSKDEISDEQIRILLQAGNEAPSAHNQQSWRFIVIRGDKKQQLAEMIVEGSSSFSKPRDPRT